MPRVASGRPTGRPVVDLALYRFQIEEWRQHEYQTIGEICARLSEEYSIEVSQRTLKRRLHSWEITIQSRTEETQELRNRIVALFCDHVLNDHFILLHLHSEGYTITANALKRIRLELGLYRRQTREQSADRIRQLRAFFEEHSTINTRLQTYGRTYLYTYIRQHQHIISRSLMYDTFRDFFPGKVTDRWRTMKRRRLGWTTPGPDFIWSIDGYEKLKAFGFQVYAGIDAHSRHIVWFYIGVSSTTQRSIVGQYLEVIKQRGIMPNIIRSDRGVETALVAGAHFFLAQPRIRVDDSGQRRDLRFRECWVYGKSINNEKIESWWLRLYKGTVEPWRVGLPFSMRYTSTDYMPLGIFPSPHFQWSIFEGSPTGPDCDAIYIYAHLTRSIRWVRQDVELTHDPQAAQPATCHQWATVYSLSFP